MTQPNAEPQDLPARPFDVLMNLIVLLLAPMFLTAANGDIAFARQAARETVNDYCARSHADLITVAQIIAFGLAALGSLGLSMTEDLSLAMTLRLRSSANALSRSAERSRRAIREPASPGPFRAGTPATARSSGIESTSDLRAAVHQGPSEAELMAGLLAAQARTSHALACLDEGEQPIQPPTAAPSCIDPPPAAGALTERQVQAMWAATMSRVAREITTNLASQPPAEGEPSHTGPQHACVDHPPPASLAPRFTPRNLEVLARASAT